MPRAVRTRFARSCCVMAPRISVPVAMADTRRRLNAFSQVDWGSRQHTCRRGSDGMARSSEARDMSMARTVAGLFPDRAAVERAIIALKDAGFDAAKIGVV